MLGAIPRAISPAVGLFRRRTVFPHFRARLRRFQSPLRAFCSRARALFRVFDHLLTERRRIGSVCRKTLELVSARRRMMMPPKENRAVAGDGAAAAWRAATLRLHTQVMGRAQLRALSALQSGEVAGEALQHTSPAQAKLPAAQEGPKRRPVGGPTRPSAPPRRAGTRPRARARRGRRGARARARAPRGRARLRCAARGPRARGSERLGQCPARRALTPPRRRCRLRTSFRVAGRRMG